MKTAALSKVWLGGFRGVAVWEFGVIDLLESVGFFKPVVYEELSLFGVIRLFGLIKFFVIYNERSTRKDLLWSKVPCIEPKPNLAFYLLKVIVLEILIWNVLCYT